MGEDGHQGKDHGLEICIFARRVGQVIGRSHCVLAVCSQARCVPVRLSAVSKLNEISFDTYPSGKWKGTARKGRRNLNIVRL